jgi:AraC-like DNA-binding protein
MEFGLCEHASVVASIGGNIHKFTPGQLIAFWANQPHGPLAVETGAYAHTIHIPLPFITKNNDIPIGIISSLLNGKVIIAPQSRDSIIPDLLLMKHWLTLLRKDTLETRRIVLLEITARLMRLDADAMRLFKEMSGVTILECLTQHRVASAQRMLLTTDMKILDIAFECGFNSPSSFYVMFARISGQEPSVYRKTAGSHAVT